MKLKKYTRRLINQKSSLHHKEFMTLYDVENLMIKIADFAIKSGADKDKMMEFFNE